MARTAIPEWLKTGKEVLFCFAHVQDQHNVVSRAVVTGKCNHGKEVYLRGSDFGWPVRPESIRPATDEDVKRHVAEYGTQP